MFKKFFGKNLTDFSKSINISLWIAYIDKYLFFRKNLTEILIKVLIYCALGAYINKNLFFNK